MRAEDSAPCVLVVDDEIGVRELLCRWLRAVGFSVKAASSAQDALEAIEQGPPAVALCDISMPGRDGLWPSMHSVTAGSRTMNSLPCPSPRLVAETLPRCISTSCLTRVNPIPNPPCGRANDWSP